MAIGLGIGLPLTAARGVASGGGEPATERIANGGFDNDVGWNSGGLWTVALGVATADTQGAWLSRDLITPLAGGESYDFNFDVVDNPNFTGCQVQLYNSSTTASQTIFSDGTTVGSKNSSGTVSGAFDQWRIATVDDAGLVIDNVSLVA